MYRFVLRLEVLALKVGINTISGSIIPAIWFLELYVLDERSTMHVCRDSLYWLKSSDLSSTVGCKMRKLEMTLIL